MSNDEPLTKGRIKELERLHQQARHNKPYLTHATKAICFQCKMLLKIDEIVFHPSFDRGLTGLCPHCEHDAIITDNNGIPGVNVLELDDKLIDDLNLFYYGYRHG